MNVLLISQCNKRALTETRRILDQFAERRGDRTWQTAITQAGLDTLRKLLRKTARKNTAVACHWIRGKDHSELLWIVGDASQFNSEGAIPTNTTSRDVLRASDENDWHCLVLLRQLAALSALLHDLGKANQAFQQRLLPGAAHEKNRYRHEWVSVRLFQAFVGQDDDAGWLQRLAASAAEGVDAAVFERAWLDAKNHRLWRDGLDEGAGHHLPFAAAPAGLPPLAQAVAWLVVSHHRLPAMPYAGSEGVTAGSQLWHGRQLAGVNSAELSMALAKISADWNEPWCKEDAAQEKLLAKPYWTFKHGLPVRTIRWRKRAARIARHLLEGLQAGQASLQDPYVMHVSRLALMLADHFYSSLKNDESRVKGESDYPLYANTDRDSGERLQRLDEHLMGVELHAARLVQSLPSLSSQLSHLVGHRGLRKRSQNAAFRWQDKAADQAAGLRLRSAQHGAFVVNMASTGCGKTLANARIMNALSEPGQGMRCAFAIGLRTLTLQTGRSFQHDLGLGDDELAILVGGAANRALFEYYEEMAEKTGSASRQALLDETAHVVYEGNDQHPALHYLAKDAAARKLLAAPLLVCTIDHLTPATESQRGGRQIAPMLRLMTGDLVLDEPDDFDLADLPALTRLVYWAGLLGSRVLLSSATLPPALVEGLFLAYRQGRHWFQQNRAQRPGEAAGICCLWVDEFNQRHADCTDAQAFGLVHTEFAQRRDTELSKQAVRRLAQVLPLPPALKQAAPADQRPQFAQFLRDAALGLHAKHHDVDPHSGKRISFGLIRMANIEPLFNVAQALFLPGLPAGTHIHLCVYHSRFPLFWRSAIEFRLDTALNRRNKTAVFQLPDIRQAIDANPAQDQLFIVLGSPVTEVGRDHDYDWAVVEPSSMRSLIQLAGRVLRHRQDKLVGQANILMCDTNLRHLEQPGKPAFCNPGFESLETPLRVHEMHKLLARLLDAKQSMMIDARPRILPQAESKRQPQTDLADLEHEALARQMLPRQQKVVAKKNWLAARSAALTASTSLPASAASAVTVSATPISLNAAAFWQRPDLALTACLQQIQPFRQSTGSEMEVVFLPDEDEQHCLLYWVAEGKKKWEKIYVEVDGNLCHLVHPTLDFSVGVSVWGGGDFMARMAQQAEDMGMSLDAFARTFARANLPESTEGWYWHPALGFARKR